MFLRGPIEPRRSAGAESTRPRPEQSDAEDSALLAYFAGSAGTQVLFFNSTMTTLEASTPTCVVGENF